MFQVVHNKSCAATDAFAILVEGWNELVQEGFTPDGLAVPPISPSSEVLFAVGPDGDIVGAIAFEHAPSKNAYVVTLGYVEVSSRRQGAFTALMDALRQRAKDSGVRRVVVEVTQNNEAALAVLSNLGIRAETVFYVCDAA